MRHAESPHVGRVEIDEFVMSLFGSEESPLVVRRVLLEGTQKIKRISFNAAIETTGAERREINRDGGMSINFGWAYQPNVDRFRQMLPHDSFDQAMQI